MYNRIVLDGIEKLPIFAEADIGQAKSAAGWKCTA